MDTGQPIQRFPLEDGRRRAQHICSGRLRPRQDGIVSHLLPEPSALGPNAQGPEVRPLALSTAFCDEFGDFYRQATASRRPEIARLKRLSRLPVDRSLQSARRYRHRSSVSDDCSPLRCPRALCPSPIIRPRATRSVRVFEDCSSQAGMDDLRAPSLVGKSCLSGTAIRMSAPPRCAGSRDNERPIHDADCNDLAVLGAARELRRGAEQLGYSGRPPEANHAKRKRPLSLVRILRSGVRGGRGCL